jgi:signal transduction histidine kinase
MTRPANADRWTLSRRLWTVLSLAGVLILVLVGAAAFVLLSVHRQQDVVTNRYFAIVNDSNDIFLSFVDAETSVRGYVLTGDLTQLQPLQNLTSPAAQQKSAELNRLVRADEDLRMPLDAAGASARAWFTEFAQPAIERVQREGPRSVDAAEVQRGRVLFDTVRADYNRYRAAVLEGRDEANQSLSFRTNVLFLAVLLGAIGAMVVGYLLYRALSRWVTQPLAELAEETRLVRSGELEHEVAVDGPAEIVGLGEDVELMRRRLVDQLAQVEAVRDGLQEARQRLETQADELQRSNRDLEQFAYVASHDLQEPLRKVASFCQLLERRYAGQLDERADQYIAFAVDGAKRMQQLINDLLAFSRIGRRTTGRDEVSLDSCLQGALRNLASAIEETGAVIDADPLPTVWGEKALLTALLQNLLSNAMKFRGEAPVRVRLSVESRRGADHGAVDEYVFRCSDNGIGIEPQYAERIFVIFQRLHAKDQYAGTGIGLAMCKKIIEWHGGRIWLDTEQTGPGVGTTFVWTLPVAARGRKIMDPAPDQAEGEGSSELVDSNGRGEVRSAAAGS